MESNLQILAIVPCGKEKIWDRKPKAGETEAKDAYVGASFRVNKSFAEKVADRWIILSAKYGFIDPNFVISGNYNVSFKDPSTDPVDTEILEEQLREKNLSGYDFVIALGGKDYTSIVKEVFQSVSRVVAPAEGLPLGRAMGYLKSLSQYEKEEILKRMGIKF
ncbi:MAG TPA: hypothetical protein VJ574_01815 [Candidatus Bathyarchaeia archaeon]|nr:hypothetical protein [Candidatus Bathyarchaeia archaeon]